MNHVVGRNGLLKVFVSRRQQLDGIRKLLLPGSAVFHLLGNLLQRMARLHRVGEHTSELCMAGQRGEQEKNRSENAAPVSIDKLLHDLLPSNCGFDAMFGVGGDEEVTANVDPCPGTFLERDDWKAVEKMVKDLFSFLARLGRDAVADLSRGIENVVADLSDAT